MFRKFIFISVLITMISLGMFFSFSQESAPPSAQPDATRRQYDHEFDRLSEEERRRLHMGNGNEEQDQSMRRSQMPVRDDSGVNSAENRNSASNQNRPQAENSTRAQVRQNAERYMRRNYPEMSERELDETIERMLDQLIEQLEARIEQRTRLRLKRQLVAFLQRLVKKYRVDPATAEDMTRERARREIEGIRNNGQPGTRTQQQSTTSQTNNQNRNESYAPPMTSESRQRVEPENQTNTDVTPAEERRIQQQRQNAERRQPSTTRPAANRRRNQANARNGNRYVEVQNPQRYQQRRRMTARRRQAARRQTAQRPKFEIKRFIIGSDKNGLIIKKSVPVLVTFTIHTNNDAGKYVLATFTAISAKDRKQYRIHVTKKFLILDRHSQYQFYWASEMNGTNKLLPNGKYRVYVSAAIHNAAGRVIAKPGRMWGGTIQTASPATSHSAEEAETANEANERNQQPPQQTPPASEQRTQN